MTTPELNFLKALAHETRWQVVQTLAIGDHRVQELVDTTGRPLNVVSSHLKKLRDADIVAVRRSEADRRDLYYSLNLNEVQQQLASVGRLLLPGEPDSGADVEPVRVLFVCTHNSARSQMAEGLMRHIAVERVQVYSAGSEPTTVHPDAVTTMQARGVDISRHQPEPIEAYLKQPFDYVITVCDRAREVCPMFPGDGLQIHWGYPDPVTIKDATARQAAFADVAANLEQRIHTFLKMLPITDAA